MEISKIKGIGPKTAQILNQKGIFTAFDLINYIPRSYDCYEVGTNNPFSGEKVTVFATIASGILSKRIKYTDCLIFTANIKEKNTKTLLFGQNFLRFKLKKGMKVILCGYYKQETSTFMVLNVFFELFSVKIEPDYKIKEIANSSFRRYVSLALALDEVYDETLPTELCKKYKLYEDKDYYYNAHFPHSKEVLLQVERRKKYEEFFWYATSLESLRINKEKITKKPKKLDYNGISSFINSLSYSLTNDQLEALEKVFKDLSSDSIMNRLIQGDVGSGKTIVAFISAYAVILDGYQVALMAPTEALARQHYMNACSLFPNLRVSLLTSQTKKKERDEIQSGAIDLLIGTHALLEDDVILNNLGLVIIDEQHRFGVVQRAKLLSKGCNMDAMYLTATPIPRTLGFAEFGDLDISSIYNKPKGTNNIETYVYDFSQMHEIYFQLHNEITLGHQAYVIVPFIEESIMADGIDIVKAEEIFNHEFPFARIAILHGKQKAIEKKETLEAYKNGEIDILISTTVIEVGIDVENATLMVILNANRFGLSQLHQLRGRIGRNHYDNYCYLISSVADCKRLEILSRVSDGFEISNEDFKLRGPGDFLGEEQSGFVNMEFADILKDAKIWECAKLDAKEYLKKYRENGLNNDKLEKIIAKVTLANTIIH